MALARYEDRNTLENRIFLDLMVRSIAAARDYLAMNRGRDGSHAVPRAGCGFRWSRHTCGNAAASKWSWPVRAYCAKTDSVPAQLCSCSTTSAIAMSGQLGKRSSGANGPLDDLWRWQRRSWAEFCKVDGRRQPYLVARGPTVFCRSAVHVRREHQRGHWLVHDDPMIVVANWERGWVVELLSGNSCDVSEKHRELCASFWLRCADLDGGDYTYIPVWTVHGTGEESDLRGLVASANMAFRMLRDRDRLGGGVVLVSQVDPSANTRTERAEFVSGCAFGPHDNQLPEALDLLGKQLLGRHIESSIQD